MMLMAQIDFRWLFGILFTTFILIFVVIFTIVAVTGKLQRIHGSNRFLQHYIAPSDY